jgi:serine/threonine protein kinase
MTWRLNLDHPNVVKLIDFSESRQYYYIVLELCPGGELFHQFNCVRNLANDVAAKIFAEIRQSDNLVE